MPIFALGQIKLLGGVRVPKPKLPDPDGCDSASTQAYAIDRHFWSARQFNVLRFFTRSNTGVIIIALNRNAMISATQGNFTLTERAHDLLEIIAT